MPTVPRNTITQTRIDRTPGVSSVTPQGAEGMGSAASAIGRMADATGAEAHAIGRQGQAIQSAIEGVGNLAVTADRIDRLRGAKQVDEVEVAALDHMTKRVRGYQDPQTGQRVTGTLDTPYDPEGKTTGEPQSASVATAKAFKEWMEDKDSPFARLSPREQKLFTDRFTPKYRTFEDAAFNRDRENDILRRKTMDKAASEAALNAINQAAPDEAAWNKTLPVFVTSEALRQNRHLMVEPNVTNEADIKWRNEEGQSIYNQTKRDIVSKAAAMRVETLLQIADAEQDDEKAKAMLAGTVAFAKTYAAPGESEPILTPDARAKTEEKAQRIERERKARAETQYRNTLEDARTALYKFQMGYSKDAGEYWTLQKQLKPSDSEMLNDVAYNDVAAQDVRNASRLIDGFTVDGDQAKLDAGMASLRTPEGKAHVATWQARTAAAEERKQNAVARREWNLYESARKMASDIHVASLKSGFDQMPDGRVIALQPYEIRDKANRLMKDGAIEPAQYDDVMTSLGQKAKDNAVKNANSVFDAVAASIGESPEKVRQWYRFNKEQGRFELDTEKKKGKKIPVPTDTVKVSYESEEGEIDKARLTVALIGEALNGVNAYFNAPQLPTKDGAGPMDPLTVARELLKADKAGTRAKLDEVTVRDHIRRLDLMTLNVYKQNAQRANESRIAGGQKKFETLTKKPNAPDYQEPQEMQ